jgi:hypothetical protein
VIKEDPIAHDSSEPDEALENAFVTCLLVHIDQAVRDAVDSLTAKIQALMDLVTALERDWHDITVNRP